MNRSEIIERIECVRKTLLNAFESGSIDFDRIDTELAEVRDALSTLSPDTGPTVISKLRIDAVAARAAIDAGAYK